MDWSRWSYNVDAKVHDGPGAPTVRLHWYFTDLPAIPIDPPTVINNRAFDEEGWQELKVGELPTFESNYEMIGVDARPPLAMGGHLCNPQWLATGEPWPVPPTLPPTVYLAGWIPECCAMPCQFEDCDNQPVNGQPASQHTQYAIPATEATADTPFLQFVVADALLSASPNFSGVALQWFPLGTNGPRGAVMQYVADPSGVPYQSLQQFVIDADNSFNHTQDAAGETWGVKQATVDTAMRLRTLAGFGQLTGTNLKIDPQILPESVYLRSDGVYLAAGSSQSDATLLASTTCEVASISSTRGVRLPAINGAVMWLRTYTVPAAQFYLYPPSGESINGGSTDAPIVIGPGSLFEGLLLGVRCVNGVGGVDWVLVKVYPGGGGGGSPGGSSGEVQYNDAGSFGGAGGILYQPSGDNVRVIAQNAGDVPFSVTSATGQTAPMQEWRNFDDSRVYVKVTKEGGLQFNNYGGGDEGYIGPNPSNHSQWLVTLVLNTIKSGTTSADPAVSCFNGGTGSTWVGVATATANFSVQSSLDFVVDVYNHIVSTCGATDVSICNLFNGNDSAKITAAVRVASSQTANAFEVQNSSGGAMVSVLPNGGIRPHYLADADAFTDTLYYSTDAGKLVYKDSGGTVNPLY